jgi:SAM-dependent methyltransferase
MDVSFWDARYAEKEFAYGKEPNQYFKEKLISLSPGTLLLPAEGEGRNAVYAAQLGWDVTSFDMSESGKRKALELASEQHVYLQYDVLNAKDYLQKFNDSFDLAAFCFTHFPGSDRIELHQQLANRVRPGGYIIFEGFAKGHERYNDKQPEVGGPKDPDMLFSENEMKTILEGFDILELNTTEVQLSEGKYHQGLGLVVRAFAVKL